MLAPGDGQGGVGVHVHSVIEDTKGQLRLVKDPGHPDADADGIVHYPNVDMSTEMVNAMVAVRAYEANVTAIEATKSIIASSLRILG